MSVYVDRARNGFGRLVMSHMIADTADELHAMADRIGVARRWFQDATKASFPHYDIAQSKRALAIAAGAIDCDRTTFVGHVRRLRPVWGVYGPGNPKPPSRCPRQVFVDDGFPPGECQRRAGHDGLCDVYDGRDDEERRKRPRTPGEILDFNGERVL